MFKLKSAAAALAMSLAGPAAAAEFSATIGSPVGGPSCGFIATGASNTPVARELVCSPVGGGSLMGAFATASLGHVGARAEASHTGGYFGTAFGITAAAEFSDFVTFTSTDPAAFIITIGGVN